MLFLYAKGYVIIDLSKESKTKRRKEEDMAKKSICRSVALALALGIGVTGATGCGSGKGSSGKTEIEVVSYKPEAVAAFEEIEKRFKRIND